MRLVDRVALVTGGSRGIGRQIALSLAEEGCHVVVAARQMNLLENVVQDIENTGCRGLAVQMDVRKSQDVTRAFQRIKRRFGRLDFLVNNAGLGFRAPLEKMKLHDIKVMLEVNLYGAVECCRRAIPIMKEQGEGCIINICSVAGTVGVPNMAVYSASKWALRGLGLSLALELRSDNIRVHNVCPGSVDTGFPDSFPKDDPARRTNPDWMLNVDDVARAVIYLATLSDRAKVDEITISARKIWLNK